METPLEVEERESTNKQALEHGFSLVSSDVEPNDLPEAFFTIINARVTKVSTRQRAKMKCGPFVIRYTIKPQAKVVEVQRCSADKVVPEEGM